MRILITTIASIYLFFNLGMSMSMHYCMGFLKDVSFGHEAHSCCCGEMEMSDSCCDDIHWNLSIEDEQIQTAANSLPAPIISGDFVVPNIDLSIEAFKNEKIQFSGGSDPPPRKYNSRIFIQSLILYA